MGKRFLAITFLSVVCLASSAVNAQALDQLSSSDQADITQKCLPVQYQQGDSAYRECVLAEADKLSEQDISATASLSFDEQYAVQQTCQPIASPAEPAYQQCVNQEIASLSGVPATQFDALDDDEIYALQQSCFDTQSTRGVKAYRQCINAALLSLQALPRPDLSELTLLERNALQLRCSAQQSSAADYRRCLLEQVGATSAQLPVAAAAADSSSNDVTTDSLATTGAVSELPAINVQTVEPSADTTAETSTETALEPTTETTIETTADTGIEAALETNTEISTETTTDAIITEASDATSTAIDQAATDTLLDVPVASTLVAETETITSTTINPPLDETPEPPGSLAAPVIDAVEDNLAINAQSSEQAADPAEPVESSADTTIELAQQDSTDFSVTSSSESALPAEVRSDFTEPSNPSQNAGQNSTVALQTLEGEQDQTATGVESVISKVKQSWAQLQLSISELDSTNRIIVIAAMALPILLIGFWLAMRGKAREPEAHYFEPAERNPLIDRVGPSQQRRPRPRTELSDPAGFHESEHLHDSVDQPDPLNLSQQADRMFGEMPAVTQAPKPMLDQLSPTEKAGFLAWLNQQPQDNRLSLAIEFLIYWIAYGDERYEPAMKEAIFQNPEPDDHDRIKRWVLMQDVYAFSDVVYWLQHNSNIAQRAQVLDLLMALLISENALTPVQNTNLRFLGDVFGLGHDRLEQQFQQAFGHAMPPLPRVDKPRWWDGQAVEQQERWDARTIATQSTELQYRVKLGLGLRGEVQAEDVTASFNRAVARCNPQRFELLGTRERSLLEHQLAKFEYAKDSLLEVSV